MVAAMTSQSAAWPGAKVDHTVEGDGRGLSDSAVEAWPSLTGWRQVVYASWSRCIFLTFSPVGARSSMPLGLVASSWDDGHRLELLCIA